MEHFLSGIFRVFKIREIKVFWKFHTINKAFFSRQRRTAGFHRASHPSKLFISFLESNL